VGSFPPAKLQSSQAVRAGCAPWLTRVNTRRLWSWASRKIRNAFSPRSISHRILLALIRPGGHPGLATSRPSLSESGISWSGNPADAFAVIIVVSIGFLLWSSGNSCPSLLRSAPPKSRPPRSPAMQIVERHYDTCVDLTGASNLLLFHSTPVMCTGNPASPRRSSNSSSRKGPEGVIDKRNRNSLEAFLSSLTPRQRKS